MKNLSSRWKYGLVAVLAVLGISSAASYNAATHSLVAQPKSNQTTSIEEQVKGAKAPIVAPTKTPTPTQSIVKSVTATSSPLIRALIPTHDDIAPTDVYIPPTQAPAQQSFKQPDPVYSDEDKDCSEFATHAEAQAFFESAGAGDPHRLDQDGDGVACETLH